jgi:hypothetical protein
MSNTPKFDFNPAPDFTQSLKVCSTETLAVYAELKRRAEIVDSIKRGTSWNLLPTETLEAIAGLMEVRNA